MADDNAWLYVPAFGWSCPDFDGDDDDRREIYDMHTCGIALQAPTDADGLRGAIERLERALIDLRRRVDSEKRGDRCIAAYFSVPCSVMPSFFVDRHAAAMAEAGAKHPPLEMTGEKFDAGRPQPLTSAEAKELLGVPAEDVQTFDLPDMDRQQVMDVKSAEWPDGGKCELYEVFAARSGRSGWNDIVSAGVDAETVLHFLRRTAARMEPEDGPAPGM